MFIQRILRQMKIPLGCGVVLIVLFAWLIFRRLHPDKIYEPLGVPSISWRKKENSVGTALFKLRAHNKYHKEIHHLLEVDRYLRHVMLNWTDACVSKDSTHPFDIYLDTLNTFCKEWESLRFHFFRDQGRLSVLRRSYRHRYMDDDSSCAMVVLSDPYRASSSCGATVIKDIRSLCRRRAGKFMEHDVVCEV
jgi:hypothetical protein